MNYGKIHSLFKNMSIFIKQQNWQVYSKYLFGGVFVVIITFGLLYFYFINLAVLKTVERNRNLAKLNKIEGEVQELEMNYISKLEKLNIPYAEILGFVEAEPTSYIYMQKTIAQHVR